MKERLHEEVLRSHNTEALSSICVTGHSLGGSLAQLAALGLIEILPRVEVVCCSFGAPRVGNHLFAQYFSAAVSNSWRVVADNDPVPHVPKGGCFAGCSVDYKHVGTQIRVTCNGHLLVDPRWLTTYLLDIQTCHGVGNPHAHATGHYAFCLSEAKKLEARSKCNPSSDLHLVRTDDFVQSTVTEALKASVQLSEPCKSPATKELDSIDEVGVPTEHSQV